MRRDTESEARGALRSLARTGCSSGASSSPGALQPLPDGGDETHSGDRRRRRAKPQRAVRSSPTSIMRPVTTLELRTRINALRGSLPTQAELELVRQVNPAEGDRLATYSQAVLNKLRELEGQEKQMLAEQQEQRRQEVLRRSRERGEIHHRAVTEEWMFHELAAEDRVADTQRARLETLVQRAARRDGLIAEAQTVKDARVAAMRSDMQRRAQEWAGKVRYIEAQRASQQREREFRQHEVSLRHREKAAVARRLREEELEHTRTQMTSKDVDLELHAYRAELAKQEKARAASALGRCIPLHPDAHERRMESLREKHRATRERQHAAACAVQQEQLQKSRQVAEMTNHKMREARARLTEQERAEQQRLAQLAQDIEARELRHRQLLEEQSLARERQREEQSSKAHRSQEVAQQQEQARATRLADRVLQRTLRIGESFGVRMADAHLPPLLLLRPPPHRSSPSPPGQRGGGGGGGGSDIERKDEMCGVDARSAAAGVAADPEIEGGGRSSSGGGGATPAPAASQKEPTAAKRTLRDAGSPRKEVGGRNRKSGHTTAAAERKGNPRAAAQLSRKQKSSSHNAPTPGACREPHHGDAPPDSRPLSCSDHSPNTTRAPPPPPPPPPLHTLAPTPRCPTLAFLARHAPEFAPSLSLLGGVEATAASKTRQLPPRAAAGDPRTNFPQQALRAARIRIVCLDALELSLPDGPGAEVFVTVSIGQSGGGSSLSTAGAPIEKRRLRLGGARGSVPLVELLRTPAMPLDVEKRAAGVSALDPDAASAALPGWALGVEEQQQQHQSSEQPLATVERPLVLVVKLWDRSIASFDCVASAELVLAPQLRLLSSACARAVQVPLPMYRSCTAIGHARRDELRPAGRVTLELSNSAMAATSVASTPAFVPQRFPVVTLRRWERTEGTDNSSDAMAVPRFGICFTVADASAAQARYIVAQTHLLDNGTAARREERQGAEGDISDTASLCTVRMSPSATLVEISMWGQSRCSSAEISPERLAARTVDLRSESGELQLKFKSDDARKEVLGTLCVNIAGSAGSIPSPKSAAVVRKGGSLALHMLISASLVGTSGAPVATSCASILPAAPAAAAFLPHLRLIASSQ